MAVNEYNVLLSGKDSAGNTSLYYPVTKLECVEGADTLVSFGAAQELTEDQQTQALSNIGAAAADHGHAAQVALHGITTEGDGTAYTATVEGIDALVAGATFVMIPHTTSTVAMPTLNVNGLGAKNLRRRVSNSTVTTVVASSTNWLYKNKPILVTFDGSYWIADFPRPNATDIYGTVAIANGGTGASTADAALENLGAAKKATVDGETLILL